eukprot:CAMPEP_0172691336 /NCGR_PEP_ID=MMETSP1074-20121228/24465_1 /TAXON_ID=2916 /ORGANISM="Ceratium fusus, Strain PA161109" /LENGTH=305 /DNA_ID=CAMNT_0013511381 /DNA_START=56 /DNA_END=973 /DNA_ORIENTATION=-
MNVVPLMFLVPLSIWLFLPIGFLRYWAEVLGLGPWSSPAGVGLYLLLVMSLGSFIDQLMYTCGWPKEMYSLLMAPYRHPQESASWALGTLCVGCPLCWVQWVIAGIHTGPAWGTIVFAAAWIGPASVLYVHAQVADVDIPGPIEYVTPNGHIAILDGRDRFNGVFMEFNRLLIHGLPTKKEEGEEETEETMRGVQIGQEFLETAGGGVQRVQIGQQGLRGHVVLEVSHLVNSGTRTHLFDLLREHDASLQIERVNGTRRYARVRVALVDEDSVYSAIRAIARLRGADRVSISEVRGSRIFLSPRD